MKFMDWHLRLAYYYGPLDLDWYERRTINFCDYLRAVLRGVFAVLGITFILAFFISWMIGDFLAWTIASVQSGMWISPDLGAAMTTAFLVIGSVILSGWAIFKYILAPSGKALVKAIANSENVVVKKEVSFFQNLYTKFHDKVCIPMTVPSRRDVEKSFDD